MKLSRSLLYKGIALASLSIPATAIAQDGSGEIEQLEEIVVTGSFIKRDKFDMASPVESIDAVDIQTSGYTTIGNYIRDLTYTANVDTVANVLSAADGVQDSNSARFNLRGLGTSSTLTLLDGRRVLNSGAVGAILPDIALERVEVILDGGAATYGTDAVAGVVNMIPIQSYDGLKTTAFYTRDGEGDIYEPKLGILWGKSFEKFEFVASAEYSKRPDALYRSDRPEYLRADSDSSTTGNPGSFTRASALPFVIDPECASNNPITDDGQLGAYPSGIPVALIPTLPTVATNCVFEYGAYQDYKRPNENLVAYFSGTYDLSDSITLKALINHSDRTSTFVQSPSTGERGSNNLMPITTAHPNNPFPYAVSPRSWRPFSNNGATQPSHLNSHGSQEYDWNYVTTSFAFGSEFELSGSWSGEAWVTSAYTSTDISGELINLDRMTLALQGNGGASGSQWFNPFFSASRYSPSYGDCEAGTGVDANSGNTCSANSQSLVDWLYEYSSYEDNKTDYISLEGFVTGDLFELPAGAVQAAFGLQYRDTEYVNRGNPLESRASTIHTTAAGDGGPASQDYNSAVINGVSGLLETQSAIQSAFTELLIPITDNVEATIAARYENFKDLNLSATVPKVSVRYTPMENLSLRASYGEGFLAPTVTELTAVTSPACAELFIGQDPALKGSLISKLSCSNGNPDLKPEESEIFNIGATWRITDELELSLDYQQIDYNDRIVRLSTTDTLDLDLANFLAANGITKDDWNDNTDAATRLALFLPWANSTDSNPDIDRDPASGAVNSVVRIPGNVATVEVDVVDFRLKYGVDIEAIGYLSASWSSTFYTAYDYEDAFGDTADAAGKQNADTDIAPPIADAKHQLRLGWLNGGHTLGVTVNYTDSIEFDSSIGPGYAVPPAYTGPTNGFGTEVAPEKIDAQAIVDLRYGYRFDEMWGGSLDLAIGANNALDERPQALPIAAGLETRLQDPTGRMLYVEATYAFE